MEITQIHTLLEAPKLARSRDGVNIRMLLGKAHGNEKLTKAIETMPTIEEVSEFAYLHQLQGYPHGYEEPEHLAEYLKL